MVRRRYRLARGLSLCVALAVASAVASAEEVETIEGCEVNSLRAKWIEDNEAEVSWSGPCKKDLAEGTGVLYFVTKDGTWGRYVGGMSGGWYEGEGDYRTTAGVRRVGRFSGNQLVEGRIYRDDGTLEFEGRLVGDDYDVGTYHFSDGRSVKGSFERGAKAFSVDGLGVAHGEVRDRDGSVSHWVVGGQRYTTQAGFDAAVQSYTQYLVARRAAEREAEAQREAAERAQREAEAARTYNAITGVLLGAANAYVQQQQAQLQAYTPPPMPVWTPPVAAYTPAPAYQAPTLPAAPTKMHRPEYDARQCVKVEPNAQGDAYQFVNRCGDTVAITWCVVGVDCNPGYTNTWDLGVGRTWPIARGGTSVNWAACVRPSSLYVTTEMSRAMQNRCVTD
jgi:hypothetical protein